MLRYIVKRLGICAGILLVVVFLIYLLMRSLPASYVQTMAMQLSQAPGAKPYAEWVQQLNSQYGLDTGIFRGFLIQLRNLVTFRFGDSWKYAMPVTEKFSQVIGVSFAIGAVSLALELLIAVPLGVLAARKRNSLTDYTVTIGAGGGYWRLVACAAAGLCCGLLARYVIRHDFVGHLLCSLLGLFVRMVWCVGTRYLSGAASLPVLINVALPELLWSMVLSVPIYFIYRFVCRHWGRQYFQ